MEKHIFNITKEDEKKRLDLFISANFPMLSRNYIRNLIDSQKVLVNGEKVKAGYALKENQEVRVDLPPPQSTQVLAQNLPLDIVYQDDDLAVINKAQGMVVHPADNCFSGTLVNALLYSVKDLSQINGDLRPGIVHRLDKDTSGLMLVAKNDLAHKSLAKQIAEKSCVRRYIALLCGVVPKEEGEIVTYLGRSRSDRTKRAVVSGDSGKEAKTLFRVRTRFAQFTLVEFTLKTGRTHQIRVHAKHMGNPVVADATYGKAKQFGLKGQLLHSEYIKFQHPTTNKIMQFSAPLPDYFQEVLDKLSPTKTG